MKDTQFMKSGRERFLAAIAVVLVSLLAILIIRTVVDAQNRGRRALERNQTSAVTQLANAMDRRLTSTLESLAGFGSRDVTFAVASPVDQAILQAIQDLIPEAQAGMYLVDPQGRITAGTLLQDPSIIGQRYDRPGLDEALQSGTPLVMPTAPGITTSDATLALAFPVTTDKGAVRGVFIFESNVSPESTFNEEISEYKQGRTGQFQFVDDLGMVIASTNPDALGEPLSDKSLIEQGGFRREDGKVIATGDVPSVGWKVIFTQDESEFEAGLGRRVQRAILLLVVLAVLGGAVAFIAVLRRLRNERQERERIEEINRTREEFISIVSHELRTPVAGVLGFLQTALDHWDTLDDDARRQSVQRAAANAQRLHAMTRDVLDTASVESGELTYNFDRLDLREAVEMSVLSARDATPSRTFALGGATGPIWVRGDSDRLQQVLMNLLENAVHHSPPDAPVDISVMVEGDSARVTVTDEGAGVSEADLDAIFEKFVRGRSRVRGTGLGLYIARQIVTAHNGEISAHSNHGKGAIFSFTIPLEHAPVSAGT